MTKTLQQHWVEALRSGEYTQCRHHLRTVNAFCVLGVRSDLYAKLYPDYFEWRREPNGRWEFAVLNMEHGHPLLRSCGSPVLKHIDALIRLNDWEGKSFPELADWIEANIPDSELVTPSPYAEPIHDEELVMQP
jgi:hypothetical protein